MQRPARSWPRPAIGVAVLLSACAHPPASEVPAQATFLPESRGSSGSGVSGIDPAWHQDLSVPQQARQTDPTRLSVHPDLYTVAFAVREARPTADAALQAARATAENVSAELVKALGSAASTKVRGLSLSQVQNGKRIDSMARVDGALELTLSATQDFWARSRLFAAIVETTRRLAEPAREDDRLHAVSFEAPQSELLDPEAYRPELLARWVQRMRQFSTAAEAQNAPLYVRDCTPPGPVSQSAQSFDEIRLELRLSCRIDTRSDTAH